MVDGPAVNVAAEPAGISDAVPGGEAAVSSDISGVRRSAGGASPIPGHAVVTDPNPPIALTGFSDAHSPVSRRATPPTLPWCCRARRSAARRARPLVVDPQTDIVDGHRAAAWVAETAATNVVTDAACSLGWVMWGMWPAPRKVWRAAWW